MIRSLFQHREYLTLNTWIQPLLDKWIDRTPWVNTLNRFIYPDIPYFGLLYELEGRHDSRCYFKNFYEFEAQRFATRSFVKICK